MGRCEDKQILRLGVYCMGDSRRQTCVRGHSGKGRSCIGAEWASNSLKWRRNLCPGGLGTKLGSVKLKPSR